jgi:pSer/pThr/pTyr-binding forkhead associated (FHA) protein
LASPAQQGWAEAKQHYLLATVEGPHTGQNFVVDHLPACIGRGSDCAISLDNDLGVSRRHAELYQHGGKLRIRDLNSSHGTKVNNYNISDKGLLPGDRIRVGYSLLIVKMER